MDYKKFKNEMLDDPIPTYISDLKEHNLRPRFSILDIIIIPIITTLIYFVAIRRFFPNGGSFYFFIIVSPIIGLVVALLKYGVSFAHWLINEKRTTRKNLQYIRDLIEECNSKTSEYMTQMEACYPEISKISIVDWARSPETKSFLTVRIGRYDADNPCRLIPKNDTQKKLSEKYSDEIRDCGSVKDVPFILSFSDQTVVGIHGIGKIEILNTILIALIVFHSPYYLKLLFLDEKNLLLPYKFIPHTKSEYFDNELLQMNINRIKDQISKDTTSTYIIVSATDKYYCRITSLLEADNVSVLTLCDSDSLEFCDTSIGNNQVYFRKSRLPIKVNLEKTSFDTVKDIIGKYKPIHEESTQNDLTLPTFIKAEDFYSLNTDNTVTDEEFHIPFGVINNGNKLCQITLCLSDSTPHGIISGTTGSGKSELILTLVTSLALKYTPSEVNFAIIDFKSGSTSDLVKEFPHCAGIASDLEDSGSIIRAIELLKTEARRRQQLLNDAVKKGYISKAEAIEYMMACKKDSSLPKLPLLVIFVDEYGNLKKQYDKFADELETITKQGRSRFMYLILADNTPSAFSSVTSNITYRICLSYQDIGSINKVLNINLNSESDVYREYMQGDASADKHRGRGIINFDGTITAFQAPFMRYKVSDRLTKLDEYIIELRKKYISVGDVAHCILPDRLSKQYIGRSETLPNKLYNSSDAITNAFTPFPIGIYDDTTTNTQPAFMVNPLSESILISGTRLSGKTTCIKTILFSLCHYIAPNRCTIFICNFGDPGAYDEYRNMPHVANVLDLGRAATSKDKERFNRMIFLMRKTIQERSSLRSTNDHRFLIVIDGYKMLTEISAQNGIKIEQLIADGKQGGISFIISTIGSRFIPEATRNQFYTRILLKNNEQELEAMFHDTGRIKIQSFQSGHAVIQDEYGRCFEMQIQLPGYCDPDRYPVAIKDYILSHYSSSSYRATAIPIIPEKLTLDKFYAFCRKTQTNISSYYDSILIGLETTSLTPVEFSIPCIDCILVEGTFKSGKTELLTVIVQQLERHKNVDTIILDNMQGTFSDLFSSKDNVLTLELLNMNADEIQEKTAELINSLLQSHTTDRNDLFVIIDDFHQLYSRLKNINLLCFQKFTSTIIECRKNKRIHFIISYAAETNTYELFPTGFEKSEAILLGTKEMRTRYASPDRIKNENIILEDFHALVTTSNSISYTKLISRG